MIAVSFALPAESREFVRALNNKSAANPNGVTTIRGMIGARLIEVLHTGVGEKVCRQRVGKFLSALRSKETIQPNQQDQQVACLISAGFAGALNNDLQIGDLILAENFSTVNASETCRLISNPRTHVANLLTIPALIDSPDERNKLALISGAVAVDMETEFIARACATVGIPLLSLRVISDTPQHGFPGPADVLFDIERQQTRILKLATHLLSHPSRVPRMIRFGGRIARARKTLADALVEIVREV
jgi:nucleoside phosphorylase